MKRDKTSALALIIIVAICIGEGVLFNSLLAQNEVQIPDVDIGQQHTMTFWLAKNNERNESLVPESAVLTIYRKDVIFMVVHLSRTAHMIYMDAGINGFLHNRTVYGLFGIAEKTVSKLYFCDIRITVESDMDGWCLERGFDLMVTGGPHWLNYWAYDTPEIGTLVAGSGIVMNWQEVNHGDEIALSISLVNMP
jgi:hypothetical protein